MEKLYRGMCPYCFELTDVIKVSWDSPDNAIIRSCEPNEIRAKCKNCGFPNEALIDKRLKLAKKLNIKASPLGDFIILDDAISEAISILNKKGFKTLFCCAGHKKFCYPYISFDIKHAPLIKDLPKSWYLSPDDFARNKYIIRSKPENGDLQYLDDILKWSKEISKDNTYARKEK